MDCFRRMRRQHAAVGVILKGTWPDFLGAEFKYAYYQRSVKGVAHSLLLGCGVNLLGPGVLVPRPNNREWVTPLTPRR